ncbi:MAG: hypothetical protein KatS3mg038_1651 [Candidatus Kapaibacterium sp.]|nr:MAG: hypothetical protein KatS3mg038_1651 [Candidatus Kapabacteria bacterium]
MRPAPVSDRFVGAYLRFNSNAPDDRMDGRDVPWRGG